MSRLAALALSLALVACTPAPSPGPTDEPLPSPSVLATPTLSFPAPSATSSVQESDGTGLVTTPPASPEATRSAPPPTLPPIALYPSPGPDEGPVPVALVVWIATGEAGGLWYLDHTDAAAEPVPVDLPPYELIEPAAASGRIVFTNATEPRRTLLTTGLLGMALDGGELTAIGAPEALRTSSVAACASRDLRYVLRDPANVLYLLDADGFARSIPGASSSGGACAWAGSDLLVFDRPDGPLRIIDFAAGSISDGPAGSLPSIGGARMAWTSPEGVRVAPLAIGPVLVGEQIGAPVPGTRGILTPDGRGLAVLEGDAITVYRVSERALTVRTRLTLPAGWGALVRPIWVS